MSEETMVMRDRCISYNFDIGDNNTLEFSIAREYREGEPSIKATVDFVEEDLTFEQMNKMVQVVAETAYKFGQEDKEK